MHGDNVRTGSKGELGDGFTSVDHLDIGDDGAAAEPAAKLTDRPNPFPDQERGPRLDHIDIHCRLSRHLQPGCQVRHVQRQLQLHVRSVLLSFREGFFTVPVENPVDNL